MFLSIIQWVSVNEKLSYLHIGRKRDKLEKVSLYHISLTIIMGKRIIIGVVLFLAASLVLQSGVMAQSSDMSGDVIDRPASSIEEPADIFFKAKVLLIVEEGEKEIETGEKIPYQKIEVEILNGSEKGKHVSVNNGGSFVIGKYEPVKKGQIIVLDKPLHSAKDDFYYIVDSYRLNRLFLIVLAFFGLAIFFGRKKGLTSILGLLFSVLVIFYFIIPKIIHGGINPLLVTLIGSVVIMIFSLYLAHGFNKRTSVALLGSVLTLILAVGIDLFFVYFTKLTGMGSEESVFLQISNSSIDLRMLLLSGIIIGVLGVLDDVTTGQAAIIDELHDANPNLSVSELYRRGLSVGREHIASLINTLVLAYVGVSFPLILLFTIQKSQPLWLTLNSNFIAEEVVRTVVGSSALILAVPITSILAAYFLGRNKNILQTENDVSEKEFNRAELIKKLWSNKKSEKKDLF
jgi:uncharacterized membrane protein